MPRDYDKMAARRTERRRAKAPLLAWAGLVPDVKPEQVQTEFEGWDARREALQADFARMEKDRWEQVAKFVTPEHLAEFDAKRAILPADPGYGADFWRTAGEREVAELLKTTVRPAGEPWHADAQIAAAVMFIFNLFTHHWVQAPGESEAEALCTGFRLRGAEKPKLNDLHPNCRGCRTKLAARQAPAREGCSAD